MPDFCAAYGCSNRGCAESRQRGITFHAFPKAEERRRQWEAALRRKNFVVNDRTRICSEHFKAEDFDRTGQTVRLRAGVRPTIFCFSARLRKVVPTRRTATSRRADDNLDKSLDKPKLDELGATAERCKGRKQQATDHTYGIPACPESIKAKLDAASARVMKLEREKNNSIKRERRAKKCIQFLLKELKDKTLVTKELNDHLERFSGLPVHLLSRQGVDYTQDQREFAHTLHLHGPKAYNYLRETLKIHLPHPSSLQRWLSSVDSKPDLNKMTSDMVGRCEEDEAVGRCEEDEADVVGRREEDEADVVGRREEDEADVVGRREEDEADVVGRREEDEADVVGRREEDEAVGRREEDEADVVGRREEDEATLQIQDLLCGEQ